MAQLGALHWINKQTSGEIDSLSDDSFASAVSYEGIILAFFLLIKDGPERLHPFSELPNEAEIVRPWKGHYQSHPPQEKHGA